MAQFVPFTFAAPGPTGPAGPAGTNGNQTDTGPTGPTGPTGLTGPTGISGLYVNTGLTGPTGPTGINGNLTNTGPTGPSGLFSGLTPNDFLYATSSTTATTSPNLIKDVANGTISVTGNNGLIVHPGTYGNALTVYNTSGTGLFIIDTSNGTNGATGTMISGGTLLFTSTFLSPSGTSVEPVINMMTISPTGAYIDSAAGVHYQSGTATFDIYNATGAVEFQVLATGGTGGYFIGGGVRFECQTGMFPIVTNTMSLGGNISGDAAANLWTNVYAVNGTIQASTQKYKTDIKALDKNKAFETTQKIKPSTWNWTHLDEKSNSKSNAGFIIEQIREVHPEFEGFHGNDSINYADFSSYIASSIQTLSEQIDVISSEVETNKQQLDSLTQ
jgi:hypothetical protein